jgi:tRNA nucleotidyltransferase/poly(A) polymerase
VLNYQALFKFLNDNPIVREIASMQQSTGVPMFVVGGSVRNLLLGFPPEDLDFVIGRHPLAKTLIRDLSEKIGAQVVHITKGEEVFYLITDEGRFDISFLKERYIRDDLRRRDYTVNAIAVGLRWNGFPIGMKDIIDSTSGLSDLKKRWIRTAKPTNLDDDPVRMLRGFRLAQYLDGRLTPATFKAIKDRSEMAADFKGARLRREFFHILGNRGTSESLRLMAKSEMLKHIFPGLEKLEGLKQNAWHHLDAWDETLEAIDQFEYIYHEGLDLRERHFEAIRDHLSGELVEGRTRYACFKLALMLHGIGKPECETKDRNDEPSFPGYEKKSVWLAMPLLEKLDLSKREEQYVRTLIKNHLRPGYLNLGSATFARAMEKFCAAMDFQALDVGCLAYSITLAAQGERVPEDVHPRQRSVLMRMIDHLFFPEDRVIAPEKLLGGAEIAELTGLENGPKVRLLLSRLQDQQVEGGIDSRADAEAYVLQELDLLGNND